MKNINNVYDKEIVSVFFHDNLICVCDKGYLDFILYGLSLKLDEDLLNFEYDKVYTESTGEEIHIWIKK